MKFSEAMELLQQAAPDFVTEVTPLNANEAQEEFFAGGCSMAPNFVYDESTDYVAGKKQIRALLNELHREDFSEAELFPIERIEYEDGACVGAYGTTTIHLKSGEVRKVNFEGIEAGLSL